MTGADLRSATLILRVLTREGDDAALAAIAEELTLADAYRDAQCIGAGDCQECGARHDVVCIGENHVSDCPVELAKQEWWAAQNNRRNL